ncbi:hypothetical protein CAPTEDRAFT_190672 [Capitella teleta]|uniref:Uncharacterized protein n=1 Tax=Capitella teleta TaxID=283909 RepID=R7T648_CAPTE|nr:hypothetical protein CAPTEDRAFT_190672 [Capitella teleta]|eukprot:ELT88860.1 hypothetical protein CAPTEDRAFT_190672 [Capitella teleta]
MGLGTQDNAVYKVQGAKGASDEAKQVNVQYKELFKFEEVTNAMQKLKTTDSESSSYHSNLEASSIAFQDRPRTPYENANEPAPVIKEHRPLTAPANRTSNNAKSQSKPRPNSSMSARSKRRPKSSPPGAKRKRGPPAKSQRAETCRVFSMTDYDYLNPNMTYSLSEGVQIDSLYGVRAENPELSDDVVPTDDVGIDELDDELKERLRVAQEEVLKIQTPAIDVFTPLYDIDTFAEEVDRPPTWAEQVTALGLRPEQLDLLHIREYPETDFRKFDYEITNTLQPNYDFAFPFSEQFVRVDFREIASLSAKSKTDSWTEHTKQQPLDEDEAKVIDRIYRICQLAAESAEMDRSRKERSAQNRLSSRTRLGSRVVTARGWKDRKCTPDCVQPMCSGDCPDKHLTFSYPCDKCREKDCQGQCSRSTYASRSRSSVTSSPPPKPVTRHAKCISCKYKHDIDAFNSRRTNPKPNPSLADSSDSVMTFTASRRRSGRAAITPHKSYYSQRRLSLTGNDSSREKLRLALSSSRRSQKATP